MSDNWIIVMPKDPNFLPPTKAQKKALALLKKLAPKSDEITLQTTDQIRFIDCGENFQRVLCPKCHAELDLDWWQDWMGEEAEANFPLRPTALPCCGANHNLNDLEYDWPQGFARFSLEAMNPQIADLTGEQFKSLEKILGCPVRKVLQHI